MARLPSADDTARQIPNAISKPAPDIRINIPDMGAQGRALEGLGNELGNIGMNLARSQAAEEAEARRQLARETERLENLRVEEAINQLRGRQLEYTHGEDGFSKYTGSDVVNRKTPLIDDYTKRFDGAINEIEGTLLTKEQKEKYRVRAQGLSLAYKADLWKHSADQTEKYKEDVLNGSVKTEEQMAANNWFSPSAIEQSKARLTQIISDGLGGRAKEFIDSKVMDSLKRVNSAVVNSMVSNGKLDLARNYITKNVSMMDVSDIIRYNGEITKAENKITALTAVEKVVGAAASVIRPNDMDRLLSLVARQESGNRDYDEKGNLITSPKGAQGRMQVMPGTQRDPGFGVRPAANNSVEEMARVGRDYLSAMIREYKGDVTKALAAYNYGPANFDKAVAKAEKDGGHWIDYVPEETRKYVKNIAGQYMSGENPLRQPTLADIQNGIRDELKGQPPEVLEIALKEAEAKYNDNRTAANQASDDLLTDIMARVDSGQLRSYDDLKPEELLTLGRNRVGARSYIDAANKRGRENVGKSDVAIEFYYTMLEDPAKLKNSDIKDIIELTPDLGQEKVNSLLNRRLQLRTQPEVYKAAQVDSDQFKALSIKFGFNPKKKADKEALTMIKDESEAVIDRIQNEEKRTLKREEKEKIIKSMMVEFPQVKARVTGSLFGWGDGPTKPIRLRGYEIKDPKNIVVPDDFREKVQAAYKAAGRTATDGDVLDAYIDKLMVENK